jgi:hypothetical protein
MPPSAAPPEDPLLYAANPILDELRRDRPALVEIAMSEDPNPPRLFDDADLPPFTASGIDPSVLASLPWPLRRPVAAAHTRADAYALVEKYAGSPGMARADLATARENADYVQAMSLWLRGSAPTSVSYASPADAAGAEGTEARLPITGPGRDPDDHAAAIPLDRQRRRHRHRRLD